jgi:hypothetical protein
MARGVQNRRCNPTSNLEILVDAELDTLATALYVRTDDLLKAYLGTRRARPAPDRPRMSLAQTGDSAVTPLSLPLRDLV